MYLFLSVLCADFWIVLCAVFSRWLDASLLAARFARVARFARLDRMLRIPMTKTTAIAKKMHDVALLLNMNIGQPKRV